ncbi:hypothetical protein [Ancylobacter polymorphus]|uniref:Uncharacterized protein n=1 Tax=Ancylobacter polymorphus TaxID=223390 RepID=A0A9E6ZT32_9HYPH|nr:hypothetical protein [Ancylobacter polymorphus]UOK71219.1 hypothetical protein K9D25_00380 [Ancylobacter polymorphus]
MGDSLDDKMTIREAYRTMFLFLEKEWELTGRPDELGSLLGSLSTLEDGLPVDPANWEQWLEAVKAARESTDEITRLHLTKTEVKK